jgi:hypothetical protein
MARVVYERIARGKEIEELLTHDWKSYPPYKNAGTFTLQFSKNDEGESEMEYIPPPPGKVLIPITGPASLMGDDVRRVCREAGLWYFFIEQTWKQTGESPPLMAYDKGFRSRWPGWCASVVREQPENIWWARALGDYLATSALKPSGLDVEFERSYKQLLESEEPDVVPTLATRFHDFLQSRNPERGAIPQTWFDSNRAAFSLILNVADRRHAELLEKTIQDQPYLRGLAGRLPEVRAREPKDETERLRFRLGATPVEVP